MTRANAAGKVPSPQLSSDQVQDLTQAVIDLTEQVRVLRQAVDEIGDELGWAIQNRVLMVQPIETQPVRLTSFPVDPLAEDFHQRVNAVSASDLPPEVVAAPAKSPARTQATLW